MVGGSVALATHTGFPRHPTPVPVLFSACDPGWLDWAAGLASLQYLAVSAALLRLQPEGGLGALLPLRPRLRALRLDGCVLLTDVGAASLAQLRCGRRVWAEALWQELGGWMTCVLNRVSLALALSPTPCCPRPAA